jgi:CheY-like chemotaxis protein
VNQQPEMDAKLQEPDAVIQQNMRQEPPAEPAKPDGVDAETPTAPPANEPGTLQAPQQPANEAAAPQPLALVVEDDFDASLIFSKALQAAGHQVEVIRAGDLAVKRLGEIAPQLVILDLHLPEVDGTEILKQIRADERLAKTRVIIVTADARMAEPIKEDADLVLLKPASYSQVRDVALRLSRRS